MRVSFSLVVCVISLFVVVFRVEYMEREFNRFRFTCLMFLFIVFINIFIFVPTVLGLVLGWDGLGVVSFLLVGYYRNSTSLRASLVVAFFNRTGDAALLMGIALISVRGHWSIQRQEIGEWETATFSVTIFLMCITKSAQVPFSHWLLAAMSAPTPVSALVHSSTLVTAGVYTLIRVLRGMDLSSEVIVLLLWASIFTINVGGFGACFAVDLKKVVALSTLRQLGFMVFSIRLGGVMFSFFHLLRHAFFKALIFVRVGRIIHSALGSQEVRRISGLWSRMPTTSGCMVLACTSLMGLPFLRGFYSKDLLVSHFLAGTLNSVVFLIVAGGIVSTLFYCIRLIVCCVAGKQSSPLLVYESQSLYGIVPRLGLSLGAIVVGYLLQGWLFSIRVPVVLEWPLRMFFNVVFLVAFIVVGFYCLSAFRLSKVRKKTCLIRSWFLRSLWFTSFLAPTTSILGNKLSYTLLKDVEMG